MPSVTPSPRPVVRAAHALWRGIHQNRRSDLLGGALLLAATVAALVLANSPAAEGYFALRELRLGPAELRLELSLGAWAADGLLAIFFFVVGLELKEEFVEGRLRDPRTAALPIGAGAAGVIAPALVYLAITGGDPLTAPGWAIPTATDIAFAIALLAVVGRFLPPALRVFLLTLAIVDDLIAISIIALAYTDDLDALWLLVALVPLAAFAIAVQRGVRSPWLLLPLAFAAWALVHASGVHATVAGVLLGFTVPVAARPGAQARIGTAADGAPIVEGLAARFADRWGPVSTLVAVPVFAFFAAGVGFGGADGLLNALADPVTLAIIAGLVLGKPIGILGATFLLSRVPALRLEPGLRWPDLAGMAMIAGIGFTVSLLVGDLAFAGSPVNDDHVKIGVLLGSLVAAVLGGSLLAVRSARARAGRDARASAGTAEHPIA